MTRAAILGLVRGSVCESFELGRHPGYNIAF